MGGENADLFTRGLIVPDSSDLPSPAGSQIRTSN